MPATAPSVKSPHILIVEDDKAIYNACTVLLQHYQYHVSLARTLAEGARLLTSLLPDLMILDLSLPDGDGIHLLETIRTSSLSTQVFILTGDSTRQTERKIRRWMPDKFFRKPLNFLEILEAIRERLMPAA
jgi:DNA-binding response OmpR family regulator